MKPLAVAGLLGRRCSSAVSGRSGLQVSRRQSSPERDACCLPSEASNGFIGSWVASEGQTRFVAGVTGAGVIEISSRCGQSPTGGDRCRDVSGATDGFIRTSVLLGRGGVDAGAWDVVDMVSTKAEASLTSGAALFSGDDGRDVHPARLAKQVIRRLQPVKKAGHWPLAAKKTREQKLTPHC